MAENRKLGCGCAVFCFVIILMLGVYLVLGRPAAMVRGEIARIAREGAPVTLKDLDGEKIPDSRNGAVVYEKAFKLVSGAAAEKDMEFIARATSVRDSLKTPAEWARLRQTVANYDAVIPIVEEAQARPECRFWIGYQQKGAFGAEFPHYFPLRNLSRVLCAKAIMYGMDGKTDEALHFLELDFGLNKALEYRPTIMAVVVRTVTINSGATALRNILNSNVLNDEQAQSLLDILSKIDISDAPTQALKVERASGISIFDNVRKYGIGYLQYASGSKYTPVASRPNLLETWRCNADEGFYLKQMREFVDTSKIQYVEAGKSHLQMGVDPPKYALVSNMFLPLARAAILCRERSQAEIDGSRIVLALVEYGNAHKAYPAKLSDLAGFLGGKIPKDPFSGEDFIYKQQGKGYTLYSIGPNLKDDGGKEPAPRQSIGDYGDIVWEVE